MMCQKCGKRTATVHLKQVINGITEEKYLCSQCAGNENNLFSLNSDISTDLLFDTLFSGGRHTSSETGTVCPLCGATSRDIQKNGKAGCAKCYEVFRRELKNAAYRIHGGVQHAGRAPGNHREEMERQAMIDELKEQQAKAIEEQNFELAAELRDKIKALSENTPKTDPNGKGDN